MNHGDAQFDEAKFVLVDRNSLVSIQALLNNVMSYLYDNSPVQAAFRLQEVQDVIIIYRSENQRLLTFDGQGEA
jgi:hypothetical protein